MCEVEGAALNDTAVMLEGDSQLSEGARVHLDLSQLPAYRVFPGQVVAVKGTNPSGSRLLVKQLWSHLPPPLTASQLQAAATARGDSMDVDGLGSSGGITAVVAAGPFCLSDDATAYEPLAELLDQLKERPPNMLVSGRGRVNLRLQHTPVSVFQASLVVFCCPLIPQQQTTCRCCWGLLWTSSSPSLLAV